MASTPSALQLQNVLYEKKGPIAYVTLNRPKVLNALSQAVFSELKAVFEDARDDRRRSRRHSDRQRRQSVCRRRRPLPKCLPSTGVQAEESTRHAQAVTELIENLRKPGYRRGERFCPRRRL